MLTLDFVQTMSNLMPLEKLNVFSFGAGFCFLTAAALSAYLIYQEDEEVEARNLKGICARAEQGPGGIITEQDRMATDDDDEQTSMQDTDFLEGSSETDSELAGERDEEMFEVKNSSSTRRLDVRGPCTTFSQELDETLEDDDSHLDQSSTSTSQDEALQLFQDRDLGEDTTEDFGMPESEEEGCEVTGVGEASPVHHVDVGIPTIPQVERVCDVGTEGPPGANTMAISFPHLTGPGRMTGSQESCVEEGDSEKPQPIKADCPDDFNHSSGDISKLYKMEEDVKISRVNNPSQSEEDEQSTSYLHYSKVTTIGVYGPSEEKDDVEELLKKRTFQSPYSERIPSHLYSCEKNHQDKCDFDEEPEASSVPNYIREPIPLKAINKASCCSKVKSNAEGMAILDNSDNLLDAYVTANQYEKSSNNQKGNGDHFPKACKNEGQTLKDQGLLTKHEDKHLEESETSICKEFLSKKDSPVLTEWYAWEKEILGDSFALEPSGKQVTPPLRRAHSFVVAGQDTSSRNKAVSIKLPGKSSRNNMEKNSSSKPKLRPWCNKPFEPKTPSDLEGGFKNKRTEKIIQRKRYVSPYCHPAKREVIMNEAKNK